MQEIKIETQETKKGCHFPVFKDGVLTVYAYEDVCITQEKTQHADIGMTLILPKECFVKLQAPVTLTKQGVFCYEDVILDTLSTITLWSDNEHEVKIRAGDPICELTFYQKCRPTLFSKSPSLWDWNKSFLQSKKVEWKEKCLPKSIAEDCNLRYYACNNEKCKCN